MRTDSEFPAKATAATKRKTQKIRQSKRGEDSEGEEEMKGTKQGEADEESIFRICKRDKDKLRTFFTL